MRSIAAILAVLTGLLLAVPHAAQAQTQQQIFGTLRVIHAAPGAPGIDVFVDGQRVLNSRDYFSVSSGIALQPGSHEVRMTVAGDNVDKTLLGEVISIKGNDAYTIAVIGQPDNLQSLVLSDNTSQTNPGEARIRVIHAAPSIGSVDIGRAGVQPPFLTNAPFGTAGYVDAPAGTYAFDIFRAGTNEPLLRSIDLQFISGWTYTLVVTGESTNNIWVQALVERTAQ